MEVKLGRKYDSIWFIFGFKKLNCKNILIWIASRQSKYENIWDSPSPPIDCRVAGRGGGNHKYTQTPIYTTNTLHLEYTPICYKNTAIKIHSNILQIHCNWNILQHKEICSNMQQKYTAAQSKKLQDKQMHSNILEMQNQHVMQSNAVQLILSMQFTFQQNELQLNAVRGLFRYRPIRWKCSQAVAKQKIIVVQLNICEWCIL